MGNNKVSNQSPIELNALLNLWAYDSNGNKYVDFDADKEAARNFFLQEVNKKIQFFYSLSEKLEFLFDNEYYEPEIWEQYGLKRDSDSKIIHDEAFETIKDIYKSVYSVKHRFRTYMGALKFYSQYAMKSFDGSVWMERYEDRVVANALLLGRGDVKSALQIASEIVNGRFQPATPTFSNSGKAQRGELVSCFLVRVEDNFESISKAVATALQLSKRGGGVALSLTNVREQGAPIKKIEGMSSGVVPVMKVLEDSFSYADQLGSRSGAGAVYLSVHHPDFERFLDTKRENADEKIRIKTLSLGAIYTDKFYDCLRTGEPMYQFSPYSIMNEYGKAMSDISINEMYDELVENPRIKKYKVDARKLFQTVATIQGESGYPYTMNEDIVNRANPIDGRISMSNLCSEILQVSEPATYGPDGHYVDEGKDISCNLGSMNIAKVMESGSLAGTVEAAIRSLTAVSDLSNIEIVPSVRRGNELSHAVGLGQMNLAGYFLRMGWKYGEKESLDFTNAYFMAVAYNAYKSSNDIAKERGETFHGFEKSEYANPEYLAGKYSAESEYMNIPQETVNVFTEAGIDLPSSEDWAILAESIAKYGIYNQNLMAVPPTGSISYISDATASIHPVTDAVETRKEGITGRVYYPQPYVTNENFYQVEDAYSVGPEKIIDIYSKATAHTDQGLSLTLFFKDTDTTKDINKATLYAWRKNIKTIYYIRLSKTSLDGTSNDECVSCML